MAVVSVNIEEMRALLTGMRVVRVNLGVVVNGLDAIRYTASDHVRFGSYRPDVAGYPLWKMVAAQSWIDWWEPDVLRRLTLAEQIVAAIPQFQPGTPVSLDESWLADISVAEAQHLATEVGQRLFDGMMSDQDWQTMIRYGRDPYFAAALMETCPPESIALAAQWLSDQFQTKQQTSIDSEMGVAEFQAQLEALGAVVGTATWSGLLPDGFADQVLDVLTGQAGCVPAALSVVLSYASCEPGFTTDVAQGVYKFETGPGFPGTWSVGVAAGTSFLMPDGSIRTDAMAGVLAMLGHSPRAAVDFFGYIGEAGVGYLLVERTWAATRGSDEAAGLGAALEVALTQPGAPPLLAQHIAILVEAAEYDNRGWHPSPGMRQALVHAMESAFAGSVLFNNNSHMPLTWPGDLPADFLDIRALVCDELLAELENSKLTPEQQWQSINYITYLLATADDPWKSLYLTNIPTISPHHNTKHTDYTDEFNYLRVNLKNSFTDPRGAFFSLFHEWGHGIDDLELPFGDETAHFTLNHETIKDALTTDVRNALTKGIEQCTFTDPSSATLQCTIDSAQQARIVDALINRTTSQLSPEDITVLLNLNSWYGNMDLLGSTQANVVSDIFGAITGNQIRGRYGHGDGYPAVPDPSYWDARPNGAASEFWAGYAANHIIGGQGLAKTTTYFPDATTVADAMAEAMAGS